jgi:hypothetical protein
VCYVCVPVCVPLAVTHSCCRTAVCCVAVLHRLLQDVPRLPWLVPDSSSSSSSSRAGGTSSGDCDGGSQPSVPHLWYSPRCVCQLHMCVIHYSMAQRNHCLLLLLLLLWGGCADMVWGGGLHPWHHLRHNTPNPPSSLSQVNTLIPAL